MKGYNTKTNKIEDLEEAGVMDPAQIVLNAVRNAISVSAAILTANTIVTFPQNDERL